MDYRYFGFVEIVQSITYITYYSYLIGFAEVPFGKMLLESSSLYVFLQNCQLTVFFPKAFDVWNVDVVIPAEPAIYVDIIGVE
jgi:hypothetical protein